jgi:uncharacterized protein
MTSDQLIQQLCLKPHPEGGFYKETYRGQDKTAGPRPGRSYSTAIYYLLVPGAVSKLHRLASDEVFHFYLGDPVTWVLLGASNQVEKVVLGQGLESGQQLQMIVKAGTWFGGFLNEGGKYALMGTTVAPGFEFEDFELGKREELLKLFPDAEKEILKLT